MTANEDPADSKPVTVICGSYDCKKTIPKSEAYATRNGWRCGDCMEGARLARQDPYWRDLFARANYQANHPCGGCGHCEWCDQRGEAREEALGHPIGRR